MELSSPSSLLSKLEELKKWQEVQQNKLAQLQLGQPVSQLDVADNHSFRNRSASKDFSHPVTVEPPELSNGALLSDSNANITKRPYLRKGSGLSKYGLSYGQHTKPFNKMKAFKPPRKAISHKKKSEKPSINTQGTKEHEEIHVDLGIDLEIREQQLQINEELFIRQFSVNSGDLTPLKAPETKVITKAAWSPVRQEEKLQKYDQFEIQGNEMVLAEEPRSHYPLHLEEMNGMQTPDNEFGEIDAGQAIMNNPMLVKCLQKLADVHFGAQNENTHELLSKLTLSTNSACATPSNTNFENVDLLKYLQNLVQKCEGTPAGELTQYEQSLEKELRVFERIEQKVMNHSYSSTTSSLFEALASTPKSDIRKLPAKEKKASPCAEAHLVVEQTTFQAKKMLVYPEVCDKDDSSVTSEDFQDTLHDRHDFQQQVIILQNASTNTDPFEAPNNLLHSKLAELEKEIATFRSETQKLTELQNEVEHERKDFHKVKRKWEAEFQEERERYECKIEEERKALMKEKAHFERYTKELLAKPNRKEREEIAHLKQELANVQEKLKLKETRSGTSQARMRNQIKSLEKDNQRLKDELDVLQKQYAKLQAQQASNSKKGHVESKMLHEINKNLTKLTNDSKISKHISRIEADINERTQCQDNLREIANKTSKNLKRNSCKPKKTSKSKNSESDDSFKLCRSRKKSINHSNSEQSSSDDEDNCQSGVSRRKNSMASNESKENDRNSSNGNITAFRNLSDSSLSEHYEQMFGNKEGTVPKLRRNKSINETQLGNGRKIETVLADGSMETKYPNGNIKTVSNDGNLTKIQYFNGDIKETSALDGTVRYFYKDTQMWQTSANGDEIFEFPDGQVEKHFASGSSIVHFPNGIVKEVQTDGTEMINYPDGSVVHIKANGEKTLMLPNGQKEIHTEAQKRREYPDGTVKIMYPDGLQETRYSNGRIRMKDKDGNLIMDSHNDC